MPKPIPENQSAFPIPKLYETPGFSKREYAAIMLRVPASGNVWLDDMIRRSHHIICRDPDDEPGKPSASAARDPRR